MNPDPLKNVIGGLISPDPNSEAYSLVCIQSPNHSPITLCYSTEGQIKMWVRDGIGLIPQANIAFTNPWGPRKLVLCSFAPSAGFISGTKC